MAWTTPVSDYCERADPGLWAEPLNALSNVAFLIAAALAFRAWRRAGGGDFAVLALIVVVAIVGLGSFAFHTLATRGAMLLDVVPIAVFIYGYLVLALRRFLALSVAATIVLVAAFAAISVLVQRLAPVGFLNGSVAYLPALGAILAVAAAGAGEASKWSRRLLWCAAVFVLSLTFRSIDFAICSAIPTGTHFLWHILNAVLLYMLLCTAIDWRGANRVAI